MTRIFELDGQQIEVESCKTCPFVDVGSEDAVPWCRHPLKGGIIFLDILNGGRVRDNCPLKIKRDDEIHTWTCARCRTICHTHGTICPRCGRDMA